MDKVGQPQFQLVSTRLFTPAVTVIMVLSVLGFFLSLSAGQFVGNWLILTPSGLLRGKFWQLLTYPFIFFNPIVLLLDLTVILFIGSSIERAWQTKAFLLFWFFVTVSVGLVWTLFASLFSPNALAAGSWACGYGFIAAFGMILQGQRFLLLTTSVDARVLAGLMIGVSILISVACGWLNLVWSLGALFGYLFYRLREKVIYGQGGMGGRRGRYQADNFVDID